MARCTIRSTTIDVHSVPGTVMVHLDEFQTTRRPWLHLVDNSVDLKPLISSLRLGGAIVVEFDGVRMRNVDATFREFVRELRFPEYFGWNWPAFAECVTDLEWLPGPSYLLIIRNAGELLADSEPDRDTLLRLLNKAGSRWANSFALGAEWGGGDVLFNTVLACDSAAMSDLGRAVEMHR